MYYLRTKPAAAAIQVTVDKTKLNRSITAETNGIASGTVEAEVKNAQEDAFNLNAMVCSLENKDECLMCGS
jgi:ribonucleoside-diphosphate reductase subunit M1